MNTDQTVKILQPHSEHRRTLNAINKILVPVDESEESAKAAEYAGNLAKAVGAEVLIVTVVTVPRFVTPLLEGAQSYTVTKSILDEEIKFAETFLKNIKRRISDIGVKVDSKILQTETSVVNAVCNAAKDEAADLIVMGTTGMTGLKRVLLGSVSSGVMIYAHCPVLVVR
jgi:nucleotide-binding universal stress UspA family protein